MGTPSRSNGVASVVRNPSIFAYLLPSGNSLSSAARSWMWIVRRSSTARPFTVPRLTGIPSRGTALVGICPIWAIARSRSPSRRQITLLFASHTRAAFSLTVSRTTSILVGELLITRSTSAIAVCCSNAASSSRVSRLASVFLAKGSEPRRWTVFGTLRCLNVFRRCVFATFPPVFPGRPIVSPEAQDRASYRLKLVPWKGWYHVCSCPLWAKCGHVWHKKSCPLYPQKQTCAVQEAMSALGQ